MNLRNTQRTGCGAAVCAAVLACLLAAGCGGSTQPTASAATRSDTPLKFAQCMRSHGVTNFPDPSPGGGIHLDKSSGIDPSSPVFQRAQKACAGKGLGPLAQGPASAKARAQMLAFAKCLRRHGVDVSDPTTSPPVRSAAQGPGIAIGRGGVFLSVSGTRNTQLFRQAAAACGMKTP